MQSYITRRYISLLITTHTNTLTVTCRYKACTHFSYAVIYPLYTHTRTYKTNSVHKYVCVCVRCSKDSVGGLFTAWIKVLCGGKGREQRKRSIEAKDYGWPHCTGRTCVEQDSEWSSCSWLLVAIIEKCIPVLRRHLVCRGRVPGPSPHLAVLGLGLALRPAIPLPLQRGATGGQASVLDRLSLILALEGKIGEISEENDWTAQWLCSGVGRAHCTSRW